MIFLKRFFSLNKKRLEFNLKDQNSFRWKRRAKNAVQLGVKFGNLLTVDEPVIGDFGAGDLKIKALLRSYMGPAAKFKYYPYDLFPQLPEVTAIDFNNDFPKQTFDLIFCLGIVEYLENPEQFLALLAKACKMACVSFVISDKKNFSPDKIQKMGWLNHFSSSAFENKLEAAGFRILQKTTIDGGSTGLWLIVQDSNENAD